MTGWRHIACSCCGECWYRASRCTCASGGPQFVYVRCSEVDAHPNWPDGDIIFISDGICYNVREGTVPVDTNPGIEASLDDSDYASCQLCCDGDCWRLASPCDCASSEGIGIAVGCGFVAAQGTPLFFRHEDVCYKILADSPTVDALPPGVVEIVPDDLHDSCGDCCGCGGLCPEEGCAECPETYQAQVVIAPDHSTPSICGCPQSVSAILPFERDGPCAWRLTGDIVIAASGGTCRFKFRADSTTMICAHPNWVAVVSGQCERIDGIGGPCLGTYCSASVTAVFRLDIENYALDCECVQPGQVGWTLGSGSTNVGSGSFILV